MRRLALVEEEEGEVGPAHGVSCMWNGFFYPEHT